MIKKRTDLEQQVDEEILKKGKAVSEDFNEAEALHVPSRKRLTKLISIRLPMDMIYQLRNMAIHKGNMGYQQLIRLILSEALLKEEVQKDFSSGITAGVSSASFCLQSPPEYNSSGIRSGSRLGLGGNIEAPFSEGHVAPIKESVA